VIGKELSKQSEKNSDVEGTPRATRFTFFKEKIVRVKGEKDWIFISKFIQILLVQGQTEIENTLNHIISMVHLLNTVACCFRFCFCSCGNATIRIVALKRPSVATLQEHF